MTKTEIINETIEYYSADTSRRGVAPDMGTGARCMYITYDGKMCAIGRCLKNPDSNMCGSILTNMLHSNIKDEDFKEEYQGHSSGFWTNLQQFHDIGSNWDLTTGTGLTERGEREAEILLNKYKNL